MNEMNSSAISEKVGLSFKYSMKIRILKASSGTTRSGFMTL